MNIIKRLHEETDKARRQYKEQMETNGSAGHLKRREKTCRVAIDEIERLREALEYIATYRFGFDGTEAGRLGLFAHNQLMSPKCDSEKKL